MLNYWLIAHHSDTDSSLHALMLALLYNMFGDWIKTKTHTYKKVLWYKYCFKGHLLCKIHFYMVFGHKCALAVCEHNHDTMIKNPPSHFLIPFKPSCWGPCGLKSQNLPKYVYHSRLLCECHVVIVLSVVIIFVRTLSIFNWSGRAVSSHFQSIWLPICMSKHQFFRS